MKKTTLFLMFSLLALCSSVNAQTDYYTALAGNNSTSQNGRAPQGFDKYNRSHWLISAADLAAAGYVNGDIISSIGFNYVADATGAFQDVPTTGSFKVYLQNTADVTNTKSATWATAITGMTLASNDNITIPASVGTVDFTFANGTAFTYTGGALYIATDYQNPTGTTAGVPNTALCSNTLTGGLKGARSSTAIPTALTTSNFRPETRLGKSVACARPLNVAVPTFTLNSADITFNTGVANSANLQYGAYDFNPATAGTYVNGVTSPYTLGGLQPSSAYEVYAKSDCGAFLGTSANTVPVSFHTIYQPANPNYNTSFEIDNLPNIGWLGDDEPNGTDWFVVYGGTGSALVQNGLYSAVSLSSSTAVASGIMYSRGVNLQGGNPVTVTFFASNYTAAGATNTATFDVKAGNSQTLAAQTIAVGNGTATTSAFASKTYTFTPPTDGVYYISLTNTSPVNGVANSTHGLIVDNFTVSQTLATNQVLESKFSTYPNPARNVINVANSTDATISVIEMTDLNGRIVKSVKFSDVAEAQVSVSDLAQGVYMMKIVSNKGIATKKIIKE
ncbi:T9SS type A sorting domain-containing protein [Flavobacterium sp. SUN052]|uniref:T9SS type A sorting domain-containing protein n=1 Tax=Flavobacterium sp. SUN052 TaxID=3002441 RepID=UPI00237D4E01|nr:T9SS type A sorting domain-containing protein [Flavobacterium sp. SUN052]MEC4005116.1 T9SS type A sorting domain-containing protein [Flavobacterium sp. SUN052]